MRTTYLASLLAAFVAACAVPDVNFTHDDGGTGIDAPDAMTDAPADVMLVVSETDLTVNEGGQGTFTVSLSAQPQSAVLISIDSDDVNRVGVTPSSVSLDASNWNQPRSITVSGREDLDTEDEVVNVNVSSSEGNETVVVTVDDNDDLGIVAEPAAGLDITEGQTAAITVHLSAQPSGPISVTVTPSDTSVITTNPTTLMFGTQTWDLDQTVVVTGVDDADTLPDTGMVTFSATGLDDAVVPVDVFDIDQLGILPSVATLDLDEGAAPATFTVRLTQQPTGNTTVNVMSSDTGAVTVMPASVTFDTTNWDQDRTITVNMPQDADVGDETATITLSATGLTPRTVSATVDDDDVQALTVMPTSVNMLENEMRTVGVRLAFQPANDIMLSVTSLNPLLASAAPSGLTFTPANYDQVQNVTIAGVQDVDAASGSTTVRIESVADGLSRDVGVMITDDDQLLIDTTMTPVALTEATTATFGVRLTAAPPAANPVMVNVSSGDTSAATVAPTQLMFTNLNYATPQNVTVTGVQDLDLATETFNITLTSAAAPDKTVAATVTDDDTQIVQMTPPTLSVNEGGSGTVGVTLGFVPSGSIVVTIASADMTAATVNPTMLTFNAGNYNVAQNVTISGVEDADPTDDTVMINGTAPMATGASVSVTVNDNDPLNIETSVTTTMVGEASTTMVGVRLTALPPGPVTVMVTSSDPMAATAMPASLNFTTGNYNAFQQVTLAGVQDADAVNDSVTLSLAATGFTTRTVNVTVVEDDQQDILFSTPTVTLTETGTAMFGVHLAAQPTSDVMVTVQSANSAEATAGPTTLTFTSANYASNQMVTVTGVSDNDLTHDMVAINCSSAGLNTRSVTATVNDVNTQEVIASSAGPFTINEGSAQTVGFSLRYIPTGSTTVTVMSGDAGLTLSPGSLLFNSGNYNQVQNVMMTGVSDANAADVVTTVTASAPGATSAAVMVTVDDDEVLGLDVTPQMLTVLEGGSNTFQVRLTAQPLATTMVTLMSNDTNAATTTQTTLTFTTGNWNQYQTVTVNGVEDADLAAEGATITVSAPMMTSQTVGVTVNDNDMLTVVANFSVLTVNEGSSSTMLTYRLSHMPAASTVVTVSSGDPGAVTVPAAPGNTLTFTTSNWNTPQPMTVNALQDGDYSDESVTLTASAPGAISASVTVSVPDDEILLDDLSVQMMPTTGASFNFLGNGFTSAVTATLGGTAISPLTVVSPTTMSATAPNWAIPQPRFQDARVVKGASQYTVARAMYRGQWTQAITNMGGGPIYALATSGVNTLYAGTDNGVYRSNDNGNTWFPINTGFTQQVVSITADPNDPNRIYAAAVGGVYVTTNGGSVWTRTGMAASASAVAMSAVSPQVLFAAYGSSVYRTTDGGTNWLLVHNASGMVRNISWGGSAQHAWIATTSTYYRTVDQGTTWTSGGNGLPTGTINWIAANPTNNAEAYLGSNSQFYRTTNGGSQWTQMGGVSPGIIVQMVMPNSSMLWISTTAGVFRYDGTSIGQMSTGIPSYAFAMSAIAAIGGSDLYVGTTAWGVYKSVNAGSNWNAASAGIDAYTVGALVAHPTASGTLFAGAGTMGVWKSTDRGATWAQSNGGFTGTGGWTINDLAFTPGQPSIMWAAVMNGGVRRSTDGGVTWSTTGLTGINIDSITPESATVAYAASFGAIRKTTDGGVNWTVMNNGLPANPGMRHVMLSDDGSIYAAESGLIYKSTNGGANWTSTPSSAAINPYRLLFEPVTGTIYVQSNSGVYKTTDDGASYSLVLGGNGFAWDPARVGTLYIGATGTGTTRRSLNQGTSWVNFNTGLPSSCHRIVVDMDGNGVYCGIGRNGLWRATN